MNKISPDNKITPFLHIYTARIPALPNIQEVSPKARNAEILAAQNQRVRTEKYYVWKLLEYAVSQSLKFPFSKLSFEKDACGKWKSKDLEFSLSHTDGVVAVALSSVPVGIDVERADRTVSATLANKLLKEEETRAYEALPQAEKSPYLLKKWVQRESAFKKIGGQGFFRERENILSTHTWVRQILLDGEKYLLSVATDALCKPEIFNGIIL